MAVRLLIVEDRDETRDQFAKLLFVLPTINVVGVAATGAAALVQCQALQPDVVLCDLTLSDMEPATLLKTLAEAYPQMRILAVSEAGAAHLFPAGVPTTVCAFLIKPVRLEAMRAALQTP